MQVSLTRQEPFAGRVGEGYELSAHSTWSDGLTRSTSRVCMYILRLNGFGNGRRRGSSGEEEAGAEASAECSVLPITPLLYLSPQRVRIHQRPPQIRPMPQMNLI